MFLGQMKESQLGQIDMPELKHLVLLAVCEFCYTDDVKYVHGDWAIELIFAADLLRFEDSSCV